MKSESGRSGEEEQECLAFILLLSFYNTRQRAHKREGKAAQAFTLRLLPRVSIEFQQYKGIYVHTDSGTMKKSFYFYWGGHNFN